MEKVVLNVEGMTCSHCESRINKVVGTLKGVDSVVVDLVGKKVAVKFDDSLIKLKAITEAIEDQGYDVK